MDGEVCGEKHSPATATEGHHLKSCSLYVIPLRPEDMVLLTALTFFWDFDLLNWRQTEWSGGVHLRSWRMYCLHGNAL